MWKDRGIIIACIVTVGLLGGGYFLSVSALFGLALMAVTLYQILGKKEMTLAVDLNFAAFGVLVLAYLFVSLWAVDSGMALLGFVKFLPLLLFYIYVSGKKEEREQVISLLPLLGSLMTLFSFLMMQFPVFEKWVSVAGRLAGFFQYPNTYAAFMLVCLIIVVYRFDRKNFDWMDAVYAVAAVFGIYMSGSRTVLILTGLAVVWMLFSRKEMRKPLLIGVVVGIVVIGVAVLVGGSELLSRFNSMSLKSSTFLGRLLYARDAIPMIVKHPFGLGYYGYYFMQQSAQTGFYSVVNVHNELLQMFLDVGVIPAVLMSAAVIRSIISKGTSARNRLVLIMMVLHSLFDYDFQFLAMGFVLILFLNIRNVRAYKVPVLTRSVLGVAGVGAVMLTVLTGVSDFCYTSGNYEMAYNIYSGNTMAQLQLLTDADTPQEMRTQAEALIAKNKYISVAYSARAKAAFSEGDVGAFIEDKLKAIELAPYQYEEYIDYLEILAYSESLYLQNKSMKDAETCVQRAEEIPELLKKTEEKTSPLAWEIRDKPTVKLSAESLELIKKMRAEIDGQGSGGMTDEQ